MPVAFYYVFVTMGILIPGLLLICVLAWNKVPTSARARLPLGTELAFITAVVIAGFLVLLARPPA